MSDLIFNHDSATSIFLWVFVQAPEPQGHTADDKYPNVSNKYLHLFGGRMILTARQRNLIVRYTNAIVKDIEIIINEVGEYYSHTSFSVHIGTGTKLKPFIDQHLLWLSKGKNFNIRSMNPEGFNYDYFLKHIEEFHGYTLKPDDEQLKKIKANYERAIKRHSSRSVK